MPTSWEKAPLQCANPISVEALYLENNHWLKRWLVRKTNCSELAADLAQDTFFRLLKRGSHVTVNEPRAYLCTIAQGMVANHFRRKDLEHAYFAALSTLPEQYVPSEEDKHLFLTTLINIDLRLAQLDPQVRAAFLLFQLEGMRQAEIALELGISLASVKRYISKALLECCFSNE